MDDAYRLRSRQDDAEAEAACQPAPATAGLPSKAVVTKSLGAYPTSATKFYAVETQDLSGVESEGSPGSFGAVGDTFYALNLGSGVPPAGTKLVVTFVPWRWVFRFDGCGTAPPRAAVPGLPPDPVIVPDPPVIIAPPPPSDPPTVPPTGPSTDPTIEPPGPSSGYGGPPPLTLY